MLVTILDGIYHQFSKSYKLNSLGAQDVVRADASN